MSNDPQMTCSQITVSDHEPLIYSAGYVANFTFVTNKQPKKLATSFKQHLVDSIYGELFKN